MGTDDYRKRLERHLVEYKRQRLGVQASGEFVVDGRSYSKAHILPRELKWMNIPEPFRREIHEHVTQAAIQPHKYFHHLNSSQALAFALFWPYASRASRVLAAALGEKEIRDLEFERVPDRTEGTNVDVSWIAAERRTYCEVKLSEREFGAAERDSRHQRKLEEIYRPALLGLVDDTLLEGADFFANYQILRNLWLAARPGCERDRVLFLLPEANVRPREQLVKTLERVRPPLAKRVRVVFIERLLERLAGSRGPESLSWYAKMLIEKYLPD